MSVDQLQALSPVHSILAKNPSDSLVDSRHHSRHHRSALDPHHSSENGDLSEDDEADDSPSTYPVDSFHSRDSNPFSSASTSKRPTLIAPTSKTPTVSASGSKRVTIAEPGEAAVISWNPFLDVGRE